MAKEAIKVAITSTWMADVMEIEGCELVRISTERQTKPDEKGESKSYRNLSYSPGEGKETFDVSIFEDDALYSLIDLALVGNKKKFIANKIENFGEEAAKNLEAAFNAVEQIKEITAYNVKFSIPEKYEYVTKKADGSVNQKRSVSFKDEKDLTSMFETKTDVTIRDFDYVIGSKPDGESLRKTIFDLGIIREKK